jgi:molybdenum cofactor cytidylyltransferase
MQIGAVILAAGAGTRMGGVAKALLRRGARTFLECIVETARPDRTVVVVGPPYGDAVGAHAQELGAHVVINAQPARGMASSVALGFAALADEWKRQGATAPREEVGTKDQTSISSDSLPWRRGALAFQSMQVDAAWLWPVDHPDVRASTLDALRDALSTYDVAQPRFRGRGGHPPLISRRLFDQLAACADLEHGARSVIAQANVIAVEVDDPGTVEDVDHA